MKSYAVYLLFIVALVTGCNKDEDPDPNKNNVEHTGDKWNIVSVEYDMINQDLSNPGQSILTGTATNAGAFYFNAGKGSFDITIEGVQKEDYYSYSESGTSVSIVSVSQNAGSQTSQNVIALDGSKPTSTTMTLEGTITRQTLTSQFVLTATFQLVKN